VTIPVKIDCECGQRYAFEVEPANGRVPSPVACPSCGADGTAAANAIIAQSIEVPDSETAVAKATTVPVAAGPGPLRVALPPNATPRPSSTGAGRGGSGLLPGQTTRTQAQHEARAKMLWGDSPLQVMAYLLTQGFNHEEASELVQEFLKERIRTIRLKGIKYIVVGAVMLLIPLARFLVYRFGDAGFPRAGAIGFLAVIGLFGAGLLFKGIGLLISPKSQSGDASEEIDPDSLFD